MDYKETNKKSEECKALYKLYSDAIDQATKEILEQDYVDAREVLVDNYGQRKENLNEQK